jgi:hypothetical protein
LRFVLRPMERTAAPVLYWYHTPVALFTVWRAVLELGHTVAIHLPAKVCIETADRHEQHMKVYVQMLQCGRGQAEMSG